MFIVNIESYPMRKFRSGGAVCVLHFVITSCVGVGLLVKTLIDIAVEKERVNERDESRPVSDVSQCAEGPEHWRIADPARSGRSYLCPLREPALLPRLSRERRRPERNTRGSM